MDCVKEVKISEKRQRSTDEEVSDKETAGTSKKMLKHDSEEILLVKKVDDTEEKSNTDSEQSNFNKLFFMALRIIQKEKKVEEIDMKNAEEKIIEKLSNNVRKIRRNKIRRMMDIDFRVNENLCGYFLRWSTLIASVAQDRILNAFNNCEKLSMCITKSTIRLISLGGGAGTEIIGFCSALQELVGDTKKTLNLTIVDKYSGWKIFHDIMEKLLRKDEQIIQKREDELLRQCGEYIFRKYGLRAKDFQTISTNEQLKLQEYDFGNVSTLFLISNIVSTFLTVALDSKTPPEQYNADLETADVVLLVRVLDILQCSPDVLKNIVERMKKGAFLLLIDTDIDSYELALKEIYKPILPDFKLTDTDSMIGSNRIADTSNAQIAVYIKEDGN